ncbi:MAG: hypothetical protein RM368_24860 [Nostoc sp. DedSLP03]|uniref:hypothetical protein n=1 Tax=Nostoc sp. DedSLP03 TaxID=3075400 RepID=UPI002AD259C8|nr:hypothetical protein [Nostoc sp. DedSLP03]MDZ7968140.1 hypothetical protein [Nostoc sp. DedSLP03]
MLDINRVLKEDRLLRALTGLNRKAFDELGTSKNYITQFLHPIGAGGQGRQGRQGSNTSPKSPPSPKSLQSD